MKKPTKNNNKKPQASDPNESFEDKLAKLGFDMKQPTNGGCGNPDCLYCGKGKLFGYIPLNQQDPFTPVAQSNVTFVPGNTDSDTFIYVGDEQLEGVTKVELCYDAETGIPVLKLEIVGIDIRAERN